MAGESAALVTVVTGVYGVGQQTVNTRDCEYGVEVLKRGLAQHHTTSSGSPEKAFAWWSFSHVAMRALRQAHRIEQLHASHATLHLAT